MNINKNLLSIITAVVLIVLGSLLIIGYYNGTLTKIFSFFNKPKTDVSGIILFYGDDCSHCKIVEDFLTANKVEEKVKITKLEVFNNKDNAQVLLERAQACGLPTDQVGVPFLWDGKTCLIGDPDVIKFFQDKINPAK